MGRKPILLTFNNRCGSIIAVDLGVKKITILTGDLKGKSCTVKEYPIDPSLSLEEYLISLLHKTKSDLPKTPCGLVGISIGIYGVVCDDLVLFTPYYDLKHSNLKLSLIHILCKIRTCSIRKFSLQCQLHCCIEVWRFYCNH